MTDQSTAEVLNDLIHVNAERISRYEKMLETLEPGQSALRHMFAKIIGESYQNKIFLAVELQAMGELIDLAPAKRGLVYLHAVARMDGGPSGKRGHILDEADVTEDASVTAYHISLHAEDLATYLKDLLGGQHKQISEARDELRKLRRSPG